MTILSVCLKFNLGSQAVVYFFGSITSSFSIHSLTSYGVHSKCRPHGISLSDSSIVKNV